MDDAQFDIFPLQIFLSSSLCAYRDRSHKRFDLTSSLLVYGRTSPRGEYLHATN